MFTGIIQAVGNLAERSESRLTVRVEGPFLDLPFATGESIAVNGACLTLVHPPWTRCPEPGALAFDVSPETFVRTALGSLEIGAAINLERAMLAGERFGGHIVQGHVDATGTLLSRLPSGEFEVFRFQAPPEYDRYLIDKGSIAVDGVSLTIVDPQAGAFDVWLVPHTLRNTNLGSLRPAAMVNLEFDVLAKHVERLLVASGRIQIAGNVAA